MRCPICKSEMEFNYATRYNEITFSRHYHCYQCDLDPVLTYDDLGLIEVGFEFEEDDI